MKTKKSVVAILIFIAILMISIFTSNVKAATLGNLTTIKERKVGEITQTKQLQMKSQIYIV